MRIVASAPTRIDLAGGTIDIWPLYLFHEGATTLNVAISLRAHVELESRSDGRVELRSIDTNRAVSAATWSELDGAGDLSLLARVARYYRLEHATLTSPDRIRKLALQLGMVPVAPDRIRVIEARRKLAER